MPFEAVVNLGGNAAFPIRTEHDLVFLRKVRSCHPLHETVYAFLGTKRSTDHFHAEAALVNIMAIFSILSSSLSLSLSLLLLDNRAWLITHVPQPSYYLYSSPKLDTRISAQIFVVISRITSRKRKLEKEMEIDRRLNCCPGRVSPEFDESFRAFPGIGATFREKQLAIASHGTIARCGSEPSLRSRLFLRLYSTASESRSVDWSHRSERRKPAQGERENSLPPISDLTREKDRAAANNENIFFFSFPRRRSLGRLPRTIDVQYPPGIAHVTYVNAGLK